MSTLCFDLEAKLPYKDIITFCLKHVPHLTFESFSTMAQLFCNDSFKLPICLYYHHKAIAAACILFAAKWRKSKGLDLGLPLKINGIQWFKFIDAGLEQPLIDEVCSRLSVMYRKTPP
jgi:hypothetical protein